MKKFRYALFVAAILLIFSGCSVISAKSSSSLSKPKSISSQLSSESAQSSSVISQSSSETKSALFGNVTNYTISNPKTYTDKHFNFSVDYPAEWTAVEDKWNPPTSKSDGSPDNGINIYVDGNKNDWIYIKGQYGPMNGYLDYPLEDFITKDMVKGKLSYKSIDGVYQINFVLIEDESGQGYHGALIQVSQACFTRNKAQILGILKSIRINK